MKPKTIVYYHNEDADGQFAAYAAWLAYGEQAEYHGLAAGTRIPAVAEGEVVVLDLGVSAENFAELLGAVDSLRIIDHHATSAELYAGNPEVCTYDPEHAACVLAWRHFHPDRPVPEIFRYVEDRDLWRFQLPMSREVSAAIASYPFTWQIAEMCLASKGLLMSEGAAIVRWIDQEVDRIAGRATRCKFAGYEVPVVNCPAKLASEVGARLLERYPDCPFSATYFIQLPLPEDGLEKRIWQLRSRRIGDPFSGAISSVSFDVGALAQRFGGGGHRAAAGCSADEFVDPYFDLAALGDPGDSREEVAMPCPAGETDPTAPVPPGSDAGPSDHPPVSDSDPVSKRGRRR